MDTLSTDSLSFYDFVDQPILIVDRKQNAIIFANKAFSSFIGYSSRSLHNTLLSSLSLDLSKDKLEESLESIINVSFLGISETLYASIKAVIIKISGESWVLLNVKPLIDNSLEEQLRKSEILYKNIINVQGEMIFRCGLDLKVTFYNRSFEDYYCNELLLYKNLKIFDLVESDKINALQHVINKALQSRKVQIFDIVVPISEKEKTFFQWHIYPVTNVVHAVEEFQVIITDVTERKSYENQLESAKEHAVFEDKIKSEFIANMSHEIRTPMNAIIGFSKLLSAKIVDEVQRKYIDGILISCNILLSLINDILDLSKIEAGHMLLQHEPTDVDILLNELQTVFAQKAIEQQTEFKISNKNFLKGYYIVDEIRVRQVLVNIIGNAIKFTQGGKVKVTFSTQMKTETEMILVFIVKDTGIGIQKEQQDIIFEAFKQSSGQSNRKYGGTGLGLTISKRLIEIMNGEIIVQSEPGVGTEFTIKIPASYSDKKNDIVKEDFEVTFTGGSILLVEDVASNIELIRGLLEPFPVVVYEANDGEEAIEELNKVIPDVILLDLFMPGMNGYELFDYLKDHVVYSKIPVIILSGAVNDKKTNDVIARSNAVVSKPIDSDVFFLVLSDFLPHHKSNTCFKVVSKTYPIAIEESVILRKYHADEWVLVKELMSIDDIKLFSKNLNDTVQKYDLKIAAEYVSDLNKALRDYDIMLVNKIFNQFDEFI